VNKNANLDLIRERLNVLDVVSTYIKVDKAGSQFRSLSVPVTNDTAKVDER
jgi:DNA primase